MPASNLLDILLEHDKWATQQILLACEKLSAEQLLQKFEIGPGSLSATVTHIIGAIRAWTDTLAERPQRPRPEQSGIQYSPAQLMQLLDESVDEFMAIARKYPLEQIVKRTREGKEYSFTRGVVITHVTTHGMHHRAQCLNMLKHLGVSPLPPSSVTEWSRLADGPR
jgi:uncharacterized damage-inducible protein DinB